MYIFKVTSQFHYLYHAEWLKLNYFLQQSSSQRYSLHKYKLNMSTLASMKEDNKRLIKGFKSSLHCKIVHWKKLLQTMTQQ